MVNDRSEFPMILVANKADLESERVVRWSIVTVFCDAMYMLLMQVPKQEGDEIAQHLKVHEYFLNVFSLKMQVKS